MKIVILNKTTYKSFSVFNIHKEDLGKQNKNAIEVYLCKDNKQPYLLFNVNSMY